MLAPVYYVARLQVEALSQNVASMLAGDANANSGDALRWIQLHQAGEIKVGMCRRVKRSALTTARSVWRLPAALSIKEQTFSCVLLRWGMTLPHRLTYTRLFNTPTC